MKKSVLLLLFCFLYLVNCQPDYSASRTDKHYTSFKDLKTEFKSPSASYRTAPLWVWHYKVTNDEIDYSLEALHSQGIGGVFIHPRAGLVTEYLSDEWFSLYNHAIEKGKSLNMNVWIYDENTYPSGFGGGHVPAEMPESYNQGQGLEMTKVSTLPKDVFTNYELVLKKIGNQYIVVNSNEKTDKGDYYIFKKLYFNKGKWYGGYSYVDLIYPGVTDKFIEVTMNGYEKHIGKEFGKSVPGIFTDEPNISTPRRKNCIRYTQDLFEQFQNRWGYDLKPNLPSLYEEIGDWRKIRHNYYGLLLELFINRWSKPWFEYTEQHNLNWTGHYWEHGWPSPHHGGDNMAMYAWHQVPAIDMLFNNFSKTGSQFGNARAVKELSSAANQMGRHRTLSETYGGAGWELTFKDMKRLGDWEYVLGVNFMNQHLTFMSLSGDRKHDYPQSFSYHEPWWHLYKPLADHYARLSVALASGTQNNNIIILEPTTSAWMYYSSIESNKRLNTIKETFTEFINLLEQNQIEYDLGSENIISHQGSVENGKFIVGKRTYTTLVLPPTMDNLDFTTADLLKQFLEQGGKVISYVDMPKYLEGEATDMFTLLADEYKSNWQHYPNVETHILALLLPQDISFKTDNNSDSLLFHMRRQLEDGQILFMANSDLEKTARGTVTLKGKAIYELNTFTGEIKNYKYKIEDGNLNFKFHLPPAGSLLLFIDDQQASPSMAEPLKPAYNRIQSSPSNIKREMPNILNLDYVTVDVQGNQYNNIYFADAAKHIWQAHGFDSNPWDKAIQYKQTIVEKDKFGANSGFKATYTFNVADDTDLKSLRAVIERPELWQVQINGNAINPDMGKWYLDRSFKIYDISNHVKSGKNEITLNCKPMSIHAELEPIYIIGNFNLESASQGWDIYPSKDIQMGSWKNQGLPFYGQGMSYEKTLTADSKKGYKIKLNDWQGTVVEVKVNDKHAGIIGWEPCELEITPYIKPGENKISVIVYGSLKNTLGPHHNYKRNGIVSPGNFKSSPDEQSAGTEYDLLDYGLLEDYEILTANK